MRIHHRISLLALIACLPLVARAQTTGTIEGGLFAGITKIDKNVSLGSTSIGVGARAGLFLIKQLELEAEYGIGTIGSNARDVTLWLPFRGVLTLNLPIAPKVKLLLGGGYSGQWWKSDTTLNQYEEGFATFAGLRLCLKNNWYVRPEIHWDHNRLPNFQAGMPDNSNYVGFRVGVSRFFGKGKDTGCAGSEMAAAAAPAAAPSRTTRPGQAAPPPPPPPPPPAARASLSASPASIMAGQSSMLQWSSSNATSCNAPWMSGGVTSGSQSVSPARTTSYTVTCNGAGGSGSASTTVSVTQPPPPPTPAAAPAPAPRPREIYRLEGVYFDFDNATLKPMGMTKLDSAVTILNRYSDMRVEIQGYTDSLGTEEYNMGLSERRATAVRDYLVSKGIATARLTTRGFGETGPVADNGTRAGRAENRRVGLVEIRN